MHHLSRGKQNTWAGLSDTLTDGCSFFCPDDGAGGQAPAVCGPVQRQRAVGAGE